MAIIWTVVQDLFFGEALQSGLRRLGHEGAVLDVSAQDESATLVPPVGAAALVVDLEAGEVALTAIRQAKVAGLPVLAFGPHVDLALHESARAAGADQVVPKSKLVRSFPDLLAPLLAGGAQNS
jgi:hypothetical protein